MAQTAELKGGEEMNLPKTIIKVMGNSENFMIEKLEHAIKQASGTDENIIQVLMKKVLQKINGKTTTSTTFINDTIESYLIKEKQYDILDRYISNRLEKNKDYADKVNLLGTRLVTSPDYDRGELQDFTINQIQIAANRYLQRDMKTGDIVESMTGWFDRVASAVVLGSVVYDESVYDKEGKQIIHEDPTSPFIYKCFSKPLLDILLRIYDKLNKEGKMRYDFKEFSWKAWDLAYPDYSMSDKYQKLYRKYFQYMYQGIFEPNTPTLMNAGTASGKCSACFTLTVEDNMDAIGTIWHDAAMIFQGAGGLGVNISKVRPKDSNISGTFGAASGPISLVLRMINHITDEVKSGGKRRGANMGLMNCITGDSEISTLNGRIPIKELVGTQPLLYCISDDNELRIRKAKAVIHSGVKKVIRIRFDDDTHLDCTSDHRIMLSNGIYKEAGKLQQFDSVMIFYKTTFNERYHVAFTGKRDWINEQILSTEYKTGKIIKQDGLNRKSTDLCTHHLDGNQLNNDPDNIEILTISEHAKKHKDLLLGYQKINSEKRKGKTIEQLYGEEKANEIKEKMRQAKLNKKPWNFGLKGDEYMNHYEEGIKNQFSNHKVISVTELKEEQDVYDIIMDEYHNFVANRIFVHNCDYPQIQEFITMKTKPGYLENFNVSVMFDADFWKHYHAGTKYHLKFGDKVYGEQDAREFIQKIAQSAWSSAEPGVVFKDNANKANPLLGLRGEIDICNPCSEQFMYDGESCTLGSINLAKLVREDGTFDWDQYVNIIHETTRFLNDVLEINVYPTEHIAEESNKSKRIGLGIMGLADLLFLLKIPYNSQAGFELMDELAKTLYVESVKESIDLAEERGACYWYNELVKGDITPFDSILRIYASDTDISYALGDEYWVKLQNFGIRNMWTTTVAPTGTISMIADTSSALEPIFALVFSKITNAGKYYYTSELFKQALIEEGIYSQALIEKVEKNYGSCQGIPEIPAHIQKVFVTAIDLHWMDHVVAQAVWQNWIDNSISKTVNAPYNITPNDVRNMYILAHDLGLKGLAMYRDGSRNEQVLHVGSNVQSNKNEQNVQKDTSGTVTVAVKNQVERKEIKPSNYAITYVKNHIEDHNLIRDVINSGTEFSDRQKTSCPSCSKVSVIKDSGCEKCLDCGWGACSSA